jgi:hypothetical protein
MSYFLVKVVEMIMRVKENEPDPYRRPVLGAEYEERERRRSTFWVVSILMILFLVGWLVWRWIIGQ